MSFLKYSLILFFITFLIFNLNMNSLGSGDTIPTKLLPLNILSGNGLYFDNYVDFLKNKYDTIYYFQQFNGHYVSTYPIFTGLIILPIYLPFFIYQNYIGIIDVNSLYNISSGFQKIAASLLASFSVVLFFMLIKKISNNYKTAFLFALIFAFGTQTFSISSQALWQHGTANFFMIASQLFLIEALQQDSSRNKFFYVFSLISAIFSFWSRPNFLLFLVIIYIYTYLRESRKRLLFSIISFIGVILLLGYNFYFFNSSFGGYGVHTATFNVDLIINNLTGLIFSPARGIIFYTPIFILSFLSIYFLKQINKLSIKLKIIFYINFIYFVLGLILNSFWGGWWGGHSWGDRLLTDIAVSAIILLYFFYINIQNHVLKLIFYLFIIYSVFIQSIGVCCYSSSEWDAYPKNVDFNNSRLWDFVDNPILRSIKAGPDKRGIKILKE